MTVLLTLNIPVAWQQIRAVRQNIEDALSAHPESARHASMMTGSELLENALKYGESVDGLESIKFTLEVNEDQITIEVSNGVKDTTKIQNVQQHLNRINNTDDKEALYLERLRELLLNPNEYGKLGLYRIAFEGQFTMSFQYTEQILRVRARRRHP